jgi:hypothetical protein
MRQCIVFGQANSIRQTVESLSLCTIPSKVQEGGRLSLPFSSQSQIDTKKESKARRLWPSEAFEMGTFYRLHIFLENEQPPANA